MKVLFISLGCDKNLVDSEEMITLLTGAGHELVDEETEAEAIVVNTCCFIHDALEESIQTVLEMARYKEEGSLKALIVAGCLAQQYQHEIRQEIPEVDAVLGTTAAKEIVNALSAAARGKPFDSFAPLDAPPPASPDRMVSTGGHYAYLKIAEGCDKHCTYCIIPKLRGPYRSVPMEELTAQAERLAGKGGSYFSHMIVQEDQVVPTVTSGGSFYRFCDKLRFSDEDFTNSQTFPQDYDYNGNNVQYVCGMSVPPNMMANIATEVYEQWLK